MYAAILRAGRLVRTAAKPSAPLRSGPYHYNRLHIGNNGTSSCANRAVDVIDPVKAFR